MASFSTERHSEAVSHFQAPGVLEKLYVPRIGLDPDGCYLIVPGNHGSGLLFLVLPLSHGVPLEKTFVPSGLSA